MTAVRGFRNGVARYLVGVEMCNITDENPVRFWPAGVDGTRGCHSPLWRRRRLCHHLPRAWCWQLSPGESLGPLEQHDGGVCDVVSLLGASCEETEFPVGATPVLVVALTAVLQRYVWSSRMNPKEAGVAVLRRCSVSIKTQRGVSVLGRLFRVVVVSSCVAVLR